MTPLTTPGLLALVALSIGGISEAAAHGLDGPPHAQNALFTGDELVAVPTSFGLLTPAEDGWAWTPEELVPGIIATSALVGGRATVGTTEGLYSTDDGGCTWSGTLVGVSVLAIAVDGDQVWVGTEAARQPSGLYTSTDGGTTFSPGELFGAGIRVGGLARGEGVLWAIVFDANLPEHQLWRDGGEGFERVDVEPADRLRLFAAQGDQALLGVQIGDQWQLETRDATGIVESWTVLDEPVDASFSSYEGPSPPYVTPDAKLRAPGGVIAEETYCVDEDFRCRSVDGWDGAIWQNHETLVRWWDIVPAECDDPSAAEEVRLYWPIANEAGFGMPPSGLICPAAEGACRSPETRSGCCAKVNPQSPNALTWLLFFALLMHRRRAAKICARTKERA